MCLITLNWQPGTAVPLLLAGNRDEFYARSTLGLHHWPGRGILAGQDLQAGGTWLGLSASKQSGQIRLAALTNYRDLLQTKPDAMSRGHITTGFLTSDSSAETYLQTLRGQTGLYNPFNLIVFDGQRLMGFESRHARLFELPVGITSVSNADFNTPWPKLEQLQSSFAQTLAANRDDAMLDDQLFKLLADDHVAPDDELPQTGLSVDRERMLSAAFVRSPDYGTRASSVVRLAQGVAHFTERRFGATGFQGELSEQLVWG